MLAALEAICGTRRLPSVEFIVLAPGDGPLAAAVRDRGWELVPFSVRQSDGQRLPRSACCEQLLQLVRRLKPAVLHGNSLSMGRLTGAIASDVGCQAAAHLRDIIRLSRAAVADLNRNALLIAVSRATRGFHAAQGVENERMCVIYNGVDCGAFAPRPRTDDLRRELGLPTDGFLILTVGQIALRKGHDVLALGAAMAADRMPGTHFVVVGSRASQKAESARFEEEFVSRFAAAGLGSRLHLLGYRADVAAIMNACDLLVHPARQEPLGRVLLEAAASGMPIVATRVGGTEEILRDGVSARLVPPDNAASLASAMRELFASEPTRRRLGVEARRVAEERFEVLARAADLASAWERLL